MSSFDLVRQFVVGSLVVRTGRKREDVGATGIYPTISMERRKPENNRW